MLKSKLDRRLEQIEEDIREYKNLLKENPGEDVEDIIKRAEKERNGLLRQKRIKKQLNRLKDI